MRPSEMVKMANAKAGKAPAKDWGECVLTCEAIKTPARAQDGHTYEKWAIEKWLRENKNRSPLTNVIISPELTLLTDADHPDNSQGGEAGELRGGSEASEPVSDGYNTAPEARSSAVSCATDATEMPSDEEFFETRGSIAHATVRASLYRNSARTARDSAATVRPDTFTRDSLPVVPEGKTAAVTGVQGTRVADLDTSANVAALMDMGFDSRKASEALSLTRNDLHRALDLLNETRASVVASASGGGHSVASFAGVPSIKVRENERERDRDKANALALASGRSVLSPGRDSSSRTEIAGFGGVGAIGAAGGGSGGRVDSSPAKSEGRRERSGDRDQEHRERERGRQKDASDSLSRRPSGASEVVGGGGTGSDGLVGIGALLKPNTKGMFKVVELHPSGAAAQSTLISVGDTLLSVDGEDIQGLSVEQVAPRIKGVSLCVHVQAHMLVPYALAYVRFGIHLASQIKAQMCVWMYLNECRQGRFACCP
jgi:hypothetical protein